MTQTRGTPTGWTIIDDIRANLKDFDPHTKADEQLYAKGLDQVEELNDARRLRLWSHRRRASPGSYGPCLYSGL